MNTPTSPPSQLWEAYSSPSHSSHFENTIFSRHNHNVAMALGHLTPKCCILWLRSQVETTYWSIKSMRDEEQTSGKGDQPSDPRKRNTQRDIWKVAQEYKSCLLSGCVVFHAGERGGIYRHKEQQKKGIKQQNKGKENGVPQRHHRRNNGFIITPYQGIKTLLTDGQLSHQVDLLGCLRRIITKGINYSPIKM